MLEQLGVQSSQRYSSKGQQDASTHQDAIVQQADAGMQRDALAEATTQLDHSADAATGVMPASDLQQPANGLPEVQQPDLGAAEDPACKRLKLDTATENGQQGRCMASKKPDLSGPKILAGAPDTIDAGGNSGPHHTSAQANGHKKAAVQNGSIGPVGLPADLPADLHRQTPLKPEEKKKLDFREKLYLAPLTTVGNLPFR